MLLLAWIWAFSLATGRADKIHDAMYKNLDASPCVRLLTKDGEIGCNTEGRVQGVLRLLDREHESIFTNPPKGKAAVVIPQALFNQTIVEKLSARVDLAGILVVSAGELPPYFSPDEKQPQSFMAKARGQITYDWNPSGDIEAFKFKRYGFAIVAISEGDSQVAIDNAKQNENKQNMNEFEPFMAEFNYPMYASGNSIDCLADATCLPLGGFSVWTSLQHLNKSAPPQPIVLATAMLDSSAFFHDLAFGANAYQSSVVSLLGAITALGRLNSSSDHGCQAGNETEKRIVAAFFQGEQFGYIGSRRFARDLAVGLKCDKHSARYRDFCLNPYKPSTLYTYFNLSNIESIVEVGQVGNIENSALYIHRESTISTPQDITQTNILSDIAYKAAAGLPFTLTNASNTLLSLPPSSIPSFLEARGLETNPSPPSEAGIGGIHIAGHDDRFLNPFFHSRFDKNITGEALTNLCEVSKLIARTLYAAAGGNPASTCQARVDDVVDCEEIRILFTCLVLDFGCDLASRYMYSSSSGPMSHYTSVFYLIDPPRIGGVPRFLMELLNEKLKIRNGFGASFHDAVDPVLQFDYPSDKWRIRQGESWSDNITNVPSRVFTEANWAFDIETRLFRKEDPKVQSIMLGLGLGLTILAGAVAFVAQPHILQKFKI
ncbi:hypothetical protein AAMO2058_001106100 [Amorphochlora amoebiformis]